MAAVDIGFFTICETLLFLSTILASKPKIQFKEFTTVSFGLAKLEKLGECGANLLAVLAYQELC